MNLVYLAILAVFLPAASAIFGVIAQAMFANRNKSLQAIHIFSTISIFGAAIISWVLACNIFFRNEGTLYVHLFDWIPMGGSYLSWAINVDGLSALMLVLVNSVSALVHLYSQEYMHEDKDHHRFITNLSFFTFCMLMLVTSTNMLQLFFGWEGVGVASYLLIGYYHSKPEASKAASKAFIANRVADAFMLLGIAILYKIYGSLDFTSILSLTQNNHNSELLTIACLALFIGCMGKSAQFLLHVWLPDAMEGPTPVSALIHAATMVTAGVFMLCRLACVFDQSQAVTNLIMIVGAITSLFAATVAMVQNDIKKIIAYSTCSQLGYMFMACGNNLYNGAMFHLLTHGFFKALLFLCAGSVIHGLHHVQDITKMPKNLYQKMPLTFLAMLVGTIAICGIPPFSGFYSKDLIIESLSVNQSYPAYFAYFSANIVALITSFYSFRLIFKVFIGREKQDIHDEHIHPHEPTWKIMAPLYILAILSAISGNFMWHFMNFGNENLTIFYDILSTKNITISNLTRNSHPSHLPLYMAIAGFMAALVLYCLKPNLPNKISTYFRTIHTFFVNKWYIDELWDLLFIKNYLRISSYIGQKFDFPILNNNLVQKPADFTSYLSSRTGVIQRYNSINIYSIITIAVFVIILLFVI